MGRNGKGQGGLYPPGRLRGQAQATDTGTGGVCGGGDGVFSVGPVLRAVVKEGSKVKNTLGDLNNHLFAQLERLSDEDLKGEQLKEEMERAKAVTGLASQIIANGTLVLKAKQFTTEYPDAVSGSQGDKKMPKLLKADFLGQ